MEKVFGVGGGGMQPREGRGGEEEKTVRRNALSLNYKPYIAF